MSLRSTTEQRRCRLHQLRERGFASVEAGAFLPWLVVYVWTGYLLGQRLEQTRLGLFAGAVLGLVVAVVMGVRAHYGLWLRLAGLAPALALVFVPSAWRLPVGVAGCLLAPALLGGEVVIELVRRWSRRAR